MCSISFRTPYRSILQCPLDLSVQAFSPAIELVVEAKPPEQDFDFTVLARAHPQARAPMRGFVGLSETGRGAAAARRGMKKQDHSDWLQLASESHKRSGPEPTRNFTAS